MSGILFTNLQLLDTEAGELKSGYKVVVEENRIVEVGTERVGKSGRDVIDLKGRVLMPGLIDCHNHLSPLVLAGPPTMLPSLIAARAGKILREMLMRGFTTLRDAGGADLGYKQAVELGYFVGPRLFVSGRALSQTGGHGDHRVRSDQCDLCACVHLGPGIGRVADGVSEVRRAVRDEIRLGADQIKVMASGGIASASDPIDQLQYSMDELLGIVDEARRLNTYVMAHAYPAEAVKRCVQAGVRTIEHGSLLDQETANLMAEKGAYLVPTLMAFHGIKRFGASRGYTPEQMEKNDYVLSGGTRALEYAKRAGVKMAYGTDIALWHELQSEEFLVRADVLTPAEIIRSATVIGAEVVRQPGKLGVIAPGAYADLLVVDGNPLENLGLFQKQGAHFSAIVANGRFVKNELASRDEDWKQVRAKRIS